MTENKQPELIAVVPVSIEEEPVFFNYLLNNSLTNIFTSVQWFDNYHEKVPTTLHQYHSPIP